MDPSVSPLTRTLNARLDYRVAKSSGKQFRESISPVFTSLGLFHR
jgi:hypothetical protein